MTLIDQKALREREARCTQEQPPACSATCPLHVDGRAMSLAIAKGDFNKARTVYEQVIYFPNIISNLCEQPCIDQCKRREVGQAIQIGLLEKAALALHLEEQLA